MKLIDEWRGALKLFSVQVNMLGVAMMTSYGAMYEQLKETIPPHIMAWISGGMFTVSTIVRLISQTKKEGE